MTKALEAVSNFGSRVDNPVRSLDVTAADVPDPKLPKAIHGWSLLIRPVEAEKELSVDMGSGVNAKKLYIPPSVASDVNSINNVGQVKAMGPLCYRDPNVKPGEPGYPHGRYVAPWCKVGHYVVWGKHQGTKVTIKGVQYVVLQDELIMFTLDGPEDISVLHNALKN